MDLDVMICIWSDLFVVAFEALQRLNSQQQRAELVLKRHAVVIRCMRWKTRLPRYGHSTAVFACRFCASCQTKHMNSPPPHPLTAKLWEWLYSAGGYLYCSDRGSLRHSGVLKTSCTELWITSYLRIKVQSVSLLSFTIITREMLHIYAFVLYHS